jgi:hypothetical protein
VLRWATLKRTPERTSSPQYASPATGVNFTISVPDFNETVYNLGNVQKPVDDHPDAFLLVRHYPDLVRAKHENKLGILKRLFAHHFHALGAPWGASSQRNWPGTTSALINKDI